jgi:type VI secretion system protein ImpE
MNARELFQAGKLDEAIQALGADLRSNPTDVQKRTFLFELLCFAGQFDRAEKQLDALAGASKETDMGTMLYRAALHAERVRHDLFAKRDFPVTTTSTASTASLHGTINGQPFQTLEDADPRIGSRLEVYAAGAYLWLPFEHISRVQMQAPKRLRDLIWITALVHTSEAFKGRELGEVLVPALQPFSWKHQDEQVRLGRVTDWQQEETGEVVPVGQKMLLVDGEELPILEVREIEFVAAQSAP